MRQFRSSWVGTDTCWNEIPFRAPEAECLYKRSGVFGVNRFLEQTGKIYIRIILIYVENKIGVNLGTLLIIYHINKTLCILAVSYNLFLPSHLTNDINKTKTLGEYRKKNILVLTSLMTCGVEINFDPMTRHPKRTTREGRPHLFPSNKHNLRGETCFFKSTSRRQCSFRKRVISVLCVHIIQYTLYIYYVIYSSISVERLNEIITSLVEKRREKH